MVVLRLGFFFVFLVLFFLYSVGVIWDDFGWISVFYCGGCLSGNVGDVSERLNFGGLIIGNGVCSWGRFVVVGRVGGFCFVVGVRWLCL